MSYNFDPEFKELVDVLSVSSFEDIEASRKGISDMLGAMNADLDTSALDIEDRNIPGFSGDPDVPVRVYLPKSREGVTGGLLYLHGGGFALGDLDTEHAGICRYAQDLGVPIVSVGYRLAPEHPFPAPLNDCYAGLLYIHEQASALNINTDKIAICGLSAGGGLSAGTVLKAKEEGGPAICHQFLGIPELDDRLTTPSMTQFTDTPMWNRPNAILSWQYYLGDAFTPGGEGVPIQAAPSRASADDVRGLPSAFISAMEFDPLRDEAIHYALKLLEAGVAVELHVYPGTFHGSSLFTDADVSKRQHEHMIGAMKRALA